VFLIPSPMTCWKLKITRPNGPSLPGAEDELGCGRPQLGVARHASSVRPYLYLLEGRLQGGYELLGSDRRTGAPE
jgi:hypothetical protein